MNNIFNSNFEVSLRVVLILDEYHPLCLTSDTITNIDFISVYGATFEIAETNLHGDNIFKFSQLTIRNQIIEQALITLLYKGLATIDFDERGFVYKISEKGMIYSASLTSDYANTFRETVFKTRKFIINNTEQDVLNMIRGYSIRSLKKGEK